MSEIIGVCHTNLDGYKMEKWPNKFCCKPIEGEVVESSSGKILHIVRIKHAQRKDGTPFLFIELWKSKGYFYDKSRD